MESIEQPDDSKYITFKRAEFKNWLRNSSPDWEKLEIEDAVVIRRQDLFASPALHTYASAIAIAAKFVPEPMGLLRIADYFQRQAELAAEEGFKVPD